MPFDSVRAWPRKVIRCLRDVYRRLMKRGHLERSWRRDVDVWLNEQFSSVSEQQSDNDQSGWLRAFRERYIRVSRIDMRRIMTFLFSDWKPLLGGTADLIDVLRVAAAVVKEAGPHRDHNARKSLRIAPRDDHVPLRSCHNETYCVKDITPLVEFCNPEVWERAALSPILFLRMNRKENTPHRIYLLTSAYNNLGAWKKPLQIDILERTEVESVWIASFLECLDNESSDVLLAEARTAWGGLFPRNVVINDYVSALVNWAEEKQITGRERTLVVSEQVARTIPHFANLPESITRKNSYIIFTAEQFLSAIDTDFDDKWNVTKAQWDIYEHLVWTLDSLPYVCRWFNVKPEHVQKLPSGRLRSEESKRATDEKFHQLKGVMEDWSKRTLEAVTRRVFWYPLLNFAKTVGWDEMVCICSILQQEVLKRSSGFENLDPGLDDADDSVKHVEEDVGVVSVVLKAILLEAEGSPREHAMTRPAFLRGDVAKVTLPFGQVVNCETGSIADVAYAEDGLMAAVMRELKIGIRGDKVVIRRVPKRLIWVSVLFLGVCVGYFVWGYLRGVGYEDLFQTLIAVAGILATVILTATYYFCYRNEHLGVLISGSWELDEEWEFRQLRKEDRLAIVFRATQEGTECAVINSKHAPFIKGATSSGGCILDEPFLMGTLYDLGYTTLKDRSACSYLYDGESVQALVSPSCFTGRKSGRRKASDSFPTALKINSMTVDAKVL